MKTAKQATGTDVTRRDALKLSGLALGGLAVGGVAVGTRPRTVRAGQPCGPNGCDYPNNGWPTQQYTYPTGLDPFTPNTPLDDDEMRITFLGSTFPPSRRAQQMMSIFVEVGPWIQNPNGSTGGPGQAADSFIFDCGVGVVTNYKAMQIGYGRMDKLFITHLHADHMNDLSAIYCFGPSEDRKWPMYVWGHGPSGVKSPMPPRRLYDDGTKAFCQHLREAMRWHTESFSFLPTSWGEYPIPTRHSWGLPCDPVPVGDDAPDDGFGLVPIELDWTKSGQVPGDNVAYRNPTTRVKITHFPVIHTRKGSMGYKLEWTAPNGQVLSMIYTSDTRPETISTDQAKNKDANGVPRGVDVFIHEMILPPELLTMKNLGLTWPDHAYPNFNAGVYMAKTVEESSHTPQGAFGYLLSQIVPHPTLTVAAHFPAADDTVACALNSVKAHCPWVIWDPKHPNTSNMIWATDLMVLSVKPGQITQKLAVVSDYTFGAPQNVPSPLKTPKYHTADGLMDPTAQLDLTTLIPPYDKDTKTWNYCENGY